MHDALPGVVTPILDSVEAISTRFLEIISQVRQRKQNHHKEYDEFAVEKEYLAISQLFRINHDLLSALGVSHPALTIARFVTINLPLTTYLSHLISHTSSPSCLIYSSHTVQFLILSNSSHVISPLILSASLFYRETSASVRVCVRTSSSKDSEESGLQCKLTGAGGGGCAITLLPPSTPHVHVRRGERTLDGVSHGGGISPLGGSIVDELREKLGKTGFETFESGLAGAGARWHKH